MQQGEMAGRPLRVMLSLIGEDSKNGYDDDDAD